MKNIHPNAKKSFEEFKVELAKELGIEDDIPNLSSKSKVGGLMTKSLVEIGQKRLKSKYKDKK